MRFKVNAPQVISETIDGETVIINLGTGFYYSIQDDEAGIWPALTAGYSGEEVVALLAARCDAGRGEIVSAVDELTRALLDEGLIVASERTEEVPLALPDGFTGDPLPFRAPRFSKYEDMQGLVLLDPVHDVSAAGWPQLPEEPRRPEGPDARAGLAS